MMVAPCSQYHRVNLVARGQAVIYLDDHNDLLREGQLPPLLSFQPSMSRTKVAKPLPKFDVGEFSLHCFVQDLM